MAGKEQLSTNFNIAFLALLWEIHSHSLAISSCEMGAARASRIFTLSNLPEKLQQTP